MGTLAAGQAYTVRLSGFPSATALCVQLIGQQEGGDGGVGASLLFQRIVPVGSVTTDDQGAGEVMWTIPSKMVKGA